MNGATAHPKLVALVPAWKAAAFIERTLDGLAAQVYPNLEILISDDASPDKTAAVCEEYASRDRRFRVIRQPRNLGWVGNVNALLREAQGDYFAVAYHDDVSEPTYLARLVEALEANRAAVTAFSDIALVHEDGSREDLSYARLDGVTDRMSRALAVATLQDVWWLPCRGVFRAGAARAIGGLRRHLAGEFSADWPWMLHMALLGEFVRVPEPLHTKFYRRGSVSRHAASSDSPGAVWDFSARSWTAVTLSAIGTVCRAGIPVREKIQLTRTLARVAARRVDIAIRHSLGLQRDRLRRRLRSVTPD